MSKLEKKPTLNNFVPGQEGEMKGKSRLVSHLWVSVLLILFVMVLAEFNLDGLNGIFNDALTRTQWWSTPDPDVALIAYDDKSSERYGGMLKIPADEVSQVFNFLSADEPKAVALLGEINDKTYGAAELQVIAQSMGKVPWAFVGYLDDDSLGRPGPATLTQAAQYVPGYISRDSFSYGADSVTRRAMITIDGIKTLYARLADFETAPEELPAGKRARMGRGGTTLQTYINWQGRAGTYQPISSEKVALGQMPRGTFTGKTVFFGTLLTANKGHDYILTPYSRDLSTTSLLEGAANSFVTLKRRDGITKSPMWLNLVLWLLVGILTVNLVSWLPPGKGILFVLSEVTFLVLGAWLALFVFHRWVDLAHPTIIAFMGYYLVVPYRLVEEYRKRWHYQEKSELMTQIELLKSNFLSLISHDLKTPVARIQGNAELLLNEKQALTEKQAKYLSAIVHTTEDLGHYVETVLDLTRVESAQVPLNKTTKDINATILEVAESKREMAAEKEIVLETSLEPLFSIKFDVRLIQRVLSNLVENAIKYSPSGSQICLSSREEDRWIRISVTDHGIGIPLVEQPKVFSKFYRCENELTKEVKGTGLGLYLVKYFVELHQGIVDLRSEAGKGSTFTISLPV